MREQFWKCISKIFFEGGLKNEKKLKSKMKENFLKNSKKKIKNSKKINKVRKKKKN